MKKSVIILTLASILTISCYSVSAKAIVNTKTGDAVINMARSYAEGTITGNDVRLRKTPNGKAYTDKLQSGDTVDILGESGDWVKVKVTSGDLEGKIGYVWTNYVAMD